MFDWVILIFFGGELLVYRCLVKPVVKILWWEETPWDIFDTICLLLISLIGVIGLAMVAGLVPHPTFH